MTFQTSFHSVSIIVKSASSIHREFRIHIEKRKKERILQYIIASYYYYYYEDFDGADLSCTAIQHLNCTLRLRLLIPVLCFYLLLALVLFLSLVQENFVNLKLNTRLNKRISAGDSSRGGKEQKKSIVKPRIQNSSSSSSCQPTHSHVEYIIQNAYEFYDIYCERVFRSSSDFVLLVIQEENSRFSQVSA